MFLKDNPDSVAGSDGSPRRSLLRGGGCATGFAKVTSCLTLLLLVCLETVLLSTVSDCTTSFYIHWNTSNPIFRTNNTDHIISVNEGNTQFEYDQVNIICPVYAAGTMEKDEDAERYIIYNVSKEEYDTCRITNSNPRIIAICDNPHKLMYYTITFRPFTPQPGGLEFPPGRQYYFISTSSQGDLHRRVGGRCQTNNMKVIFKVCCRPEEERRRSTTVAPTTRSPPPQLEGFTRVHPTARSRTTSPYPWYPSSTEEEDRLKKIQEKKKMQEFEHHPNEIVKNEELTHGGSSSTGNIAGNVVLLLILAFVSFNILVS